MTPLGFVSGGVFLLSLRKYNDTRPYYLTFKFMSTPLTEGSRVPDVVFKTRVRDDSVAGENPFRWQDVTTAELFAGKKVVVFSLPGAFTPTCSSTHLPGYEKHYEEFKDLGILV